MGMSWALDMGECRNGKLRGAAHSSLMGRMWIASVVAKELLRWLRGAAASPLLELVLVAALHSWLLGMSV